MVLWSAVAMSEVGFGARGVAVMSECDGVVMLP